MKRIINLDYDLSPSIGHVYNANIVRKYLKEGDRILDIGCWSAQLLLALEKKDKKFRYYGIDVDSKVINYVKLKKKAVFKQASVLKIPFKSNYFDLVVLFDVLEHIPDGTEINCFTEIKRVIKKNGILILSTPADNIMSKIFDPAYFLLNHRHYSDQTIIEFFKKTGFKIKEFNTTGSIFYGMYILLQLIFKHFLNRPYPNDKLFNEVQKKAAKEIYQNGFIGHYVVSVAQKNDKST